MLKGPEIVALPVSVPPPSLVIVNLRVLLLPTCTEPKGRAVSETKSLGAAAVEDVIDGSWIFDAEGTSHGPSLIDAEENWQQKT